MEFDPIWYLYRRIDGLYMGNGTPYYDDEEIGSTDLPTPEYDSETEVIYFKDGSWHKILIADIPVPELSPESTEAP